MAKTMGSRLTRRTVVRGGLGGAALLATQAGGVRSTRAAQDAPSLSFMNWDPIEGTPLEAALNAFQAQTGVTIDVQPTPGDDDYTTKMRTLLASGSPPDVMRIDDDLVRGFAAADQLLDLRSRIEQSNVAQDYVEPLFRFPIQQDGSHVAWVIGVQPRVIYYNVDHFNAAGVPLPPGAWTGENWQWDDFLEAAKALTIPGERWGALVYGDNAYEQTFSVNNGEPGGIYSADGLQFTLANPKGVEAVQWVADLTCEHEVQPPWSELQQDDVRQQLFASGRVSMLFGAFALTPYFHRNAPELNWDVAPVPARVDQKQEGSLIVFTIPKDAKNPDAAWELLTFLGGPEGARIFAEGKYFIPANAGAATAIEPGELPPTHIGLFAEAANFQSAVSPSQYQERAEQIYRPQLDLVYTCQTTAEEALTSLRGQVEGELAGGV